MKLGLVLLARVTTPIGGVQPSPPYPQSPVIEKTNALLCLILNVFVPGVGTIAAGVMGNQKLFGRGIAQFITVILLGFGWFWGIYTGIQLLQNATWRESQPVTPRSA